MIGFATSRRKPQGCTGVAGSGGRYELRAADPKAAKRAELQSSRRKKTLATTRSDGRSLDSLPGSCNAHALESLGSTPDTNTMLRVHYL